MFNSGEHCRATRQDDIPVEVTANVNVALHDRTATAGCINTNRGNRFGVRYAHGLVDAKGFKTKHAGLEQDFGSAEARQMI